MKLDLPELELLCAYNNEIAELDLSNLKNVNTLSLHHNLLTDINVKTLGKLEYIWIDNNKLKNVRFVAKPNDFNRSMLFE